MHLIASIRGSRGERQCSRPTAQLTGTKPNPQGELPETYRPSRNGPSLVGEHRCASVSDEMRLLSAPGVTSLT